MTKVILRSLAAGSLCVVLAGEVEAATYNPFGIQQGVSQSTVATGGWNLVYSGAYGDNVPFSIAFNNLSDWVMLASAQVGSNSFELLASIRTSDFLSLPSGLNETGQFNGATWYRNVFSMGFAPANSTIDQNSADVTGSGFLSPLSDEGLLRPSWHTNNPNFDLTGGWRSGNSIFLNESQDWTRYVFTASDSLSPVPLPAPILLLLCALGSLGLFKRRKGATHSA